MAAPRVRMALVPVAEAAAPALAAGRGWLTHEEAARLGAMRSHTRRDAFLAGHWAARRLAAEWLQVEARRVAIAPLPDGRPALRLDGAPLPLSLSIAHSGDWLALALGDVAVGVDIELPKRGRDILALAGFAFSEQEARRLQAMSATERTATFHALWTLKEACVKRSGEGLRPRQARVVEPLACAPGSAAAMSWAFRGGAVALAAGMGIRLDGAEALAEAPRYWRYRRAAGA